MNTHPQAGYTEEPRLIPPRRPGRAADRPAGTAGPIGRAYLKAAIARLRIEPPQRTAQAETEMEAGG
jgi:hypothetical protein